MTRTLAVLSYLLQTMAVASLLLLMGSLLRSTRVRFSALRIVKAWRLALVLIAVLTWILGSGAMAWRDRIEGRASLEMSQGPEAELVQKASLRGLQRELAGARGDARRTAQEAFRMAEAAWAARRYREAAEGYAQSIGTVPTTAGYLNLGLARLSLDEFGSAEAVFRSGLELARRTGNANEAGACLDGIGWAARGQGRLAEALASHEAALEAHTEAGNPVGRAIAHAGIASVYAEEGRLAEALIAHREAFVLYTRLKNLLGRANALNRIGDVYGRLGKSDEALLAYQEALTLDRELGNLLGQARDLQGIAGAHLAQGKRQASLDALEQARAAYRDAGVLSKGAKAADRLIAKLRTTATGRP